MATMPETAIQTLTGRWGTLTREHAPTRIYTVDRHHDSPADLFIPLLPLFKDRHLYLVSSCERYRSDEPAGHHTDTLRSCRDREPQPFRGGPVSPLYELGTTDGKRTVRSAGGLGGEYARRSGSERRHLTRHPTTTLV